MKRKLFAAAAAALALSVAACAPQPYGPGYGTGPGMMGGGYGPGYGTGPGMMGGGYGPGYGTGPGMMGGGYGPGHGMGPGMMGGGYGPGHGMGPGMMGGGYGPGYGMGPGMMGGYGYVPDLTDEQRAKLGEIQQEFAKTRWALMSAMHGEGGPMALMYSGEEKAMRQAYDAMSAMHKQMFETSLEMRKRVDAVLTDEQRAQMRRDWR